MTIEMNAPATRREAIVRILRDMDVGRQSELVSLLRRQGFDATQSSVSRDLREIGVVKAGDRYLLPQYEDALTPSHFETVASFVKSYKPAGDHLTVVLTSAGSAQSVAIAMDKARWPEVTGTIAGDDTIFIATESAPAQRRLHSRLRNTFSL